MASIKHSFAAFLASVLLTSGVQGQSSFSLLQCTYNSDATALENQNNDSTETGNHLRTYEILCGKPANMVSFDNPAGQNNINNGPVDINTAAATFEILCEYINETPDVKKFIGEDRNRHTIFAPTDEAFNSISGERAKFDSDMVKTILQLHILKETYLTSDLECDEVYNTLNLDGESSPSSDRQSITRCRGDAGSIQQLGGGNSKSEIYPMVGNPINIWSLSSDFLESGAIADSNTGFTSTVESIDNGNNNVDVLKALFSSNVIGCNGVIQVVDEVLLPPSFTDSGSKSGKSKGSKAGKRRELVFGDMNNNNNKNNNNDEAAKQDREVSRENRRRRLEALLEPNGNIEQLN